MTSRLSQNGTGPGSTRRPGTRRRRRPTRRCRRSARRWRSPGTTTARTRGCSGAFGAGLVVGAGHEGRRRADQCAGAPATEVVTYPDGEEVGFGLNADGAYSAAARPVRDPGHGLRRAGSR